jgi:hypothetical protein
MNKKANKKFKPTPKRRLNLVGLRINMGGEKQGDTHL